MRRYIRMENKTGNMKTMRAYKFRIYPDTKRQIAKSSKDKGHESSRQDGRKNIPFGRIRLF